MTRAALIGAMAGIVLLVAGFGLGRWARPAKVVEKVKTVEVTKQAEHKETSATAERLATTDVITRWRTRVVRLPDGTTVEDRRADTESRARSGERTKERAAETKTVEVVREVERLKLVERSQPRWTVGAYGGLDLGGKQIYGGRIERRLIGELSAGLQADTRGAVMATLTVRF